MALKTFSFSGADWVNPDVTDCNYWEACVEAIRYKSALVNESCAMIPPFCENKGMIPKASYIESMIRQIEKICVKYRNTHDPKYLSSVVFRSTPGGTPWTVSVDGEGYALIPQAAEYIDAGTVDQYSWTSLCIAAGLTDQQLSFVSSEAYYSNNAEKNKSILIAIKKLIEKLVVVTFGQMKITLQCDEEWDWRLNYAISYNTYVYPSGNVGRVEGCCLNANYFDDPWDECNCHTSGSQNPPCIWTHPNGAKQSEIDTVYNNSCVRKAIFADGENAGYLPQDQIYRGGFLLLTTAFSTFCGTIIWDSSSCYMAITRTYSSDDGSCSGSIIDTENKYSLFGYKFSHFGEGKLYIETSNDSVHEIKYSSTFNTTKSYGNTSEITCKIGKETGHDPGFGTEVWSAWQCEPGYGFNDFEYKSLNIEPDKSWQDEGLFWIKPDYSKFPSSLKATMFTEENP